MIRVLIAEDFPQMIQVMGKILEAAGDITVVDIVKDFQIVLERVLETDFDVMLLDDYLPPTTCVFASQRLREIGVETPMLVMSMQWDAELICDSLAAGANGFILKEEFTEHLLPAIRALYGGQTFLSPLATGILADKNSRV